MKPWLEKARDLLANSLDPPKHELNEIDWKEAISSDKKRLSEHLCAFGNYPGGGCFVFGIEDDGNLVGVSSSQIAEIINQLTNIGRDAVEPPLQLDHMTLEFRGSDLLFVHVTESKIKPVHRRGRPIDETFIRSGATTRKASYQDVGSMMLHSQTPRWELLHASLLMNEEEILNVLNIDPILVMLGTPIPTSMGERLRWMAESSFIERHAAGGGYITNLGAISCARRLDSFPGLERKAVRVVVYDGLSKAKARSEIGGRYGYALSFQGLIRYVCGLLPTSEVIEEALRQKTTVYPELALREIIANAVIHQDFTVSGSGPMVDIYDDRIEISNPGRLLPSKSLDRLIGTQPESRNEKLAHAFRMYKICEERGSGLIKAGMQVEVYGLPPIKFEQEPNHFKVTLFAPKTFAQMSAAERLSACYQHALLKYLSSSVMTNKSLRERLKMPEKQRSMVSALIQEAIDQNLICAAKPENKSKKYAEYIPAWAMTKPV